eukprot:GHUV01033767.1.p2 GENE.GHUV01033767.1~~GHUV01033767.1.p2  ORF type:complete len:124 (-),score=4.46 GHUV01033767.1:43-414(-)
MGPGAISARQSTIRSGIPAHCSLPIQSDDVFQNIKSLAFWQRTYCTHWIGTTKAFCGKTISGFLFQLFNLFIFITGHESIVSSRYLLELLLCFLLIVGVFVRVPLHGKLLVSLLDVDLAGSHG